jgi:hypothetical protein
MRTEAPTAGDEWRTLKLKKTSKLDVPRLSTDPPTRASRACSGSEWN